MWVKLLRNNDPEPLGDEWMSGEGGGKFFYNLKFRSLLITYFGIFEH